LAYLAQQAAMARNVPDLPDFAGKTAGRRQSVDFSLAIGAAVPQQVELQRLPPQISSVIGGYQGDDYVIVGDQLVIIDPSARRVVAIVSNVG
jgi:hypothetical protein